MSKNLAAHSVVGLEILEALGRAPQRREPLRRARRRAAVSP